MQNWAVAALIGFVANCGAKTQEGPSDTSSGANETGSEMKDDAASEGTADSEATITDLDAQASDGVSESLPSADGAAVGDASVCPDPSIDPTAWLACVQNLYPEFNGPDGCPAAMGQCPATAPSPNSDCPRGPSFGCGQGGPNSCGARIFEACYYGQVLCQCVWGPDWGEAQGLWECGHATCDSPP